MKKFIYLFIFATLGVRANSGSLLVEPATPQGRVIFITGSCSSGKSTLARNIAQNLNAKYFAFDEYVMPIVLKKMIATHVGSFFAFFLTKLLMHNFFTLIGFLSDKRKYAFQKKFYADLQRGIAIEPTIKMYRAARNVALQGKDVIIEAPLQLGDKIDCLSSLSVLQDLNVTLILAYCPWEQLVERIKTRNQSRYKKSHRELDWAIGNFVHCFNVSTKHTTRAIDRIHGNVVQQFVTTHTQPEYKKKRLYILNETKEATLRCFKTDRMNYVYPRLEYDLVVNTQTYNPKQTATRVLSFINNRSTQTFKQNILAKKALVQIKFYYT